MTSHVWVADVIAAVAALAAVGQWLEARRARAEAEDCRKKLLQGGERLIDRIMTVIDAALIDHRADPRRSARHLHNYAQAQAGGLARLGAELQHLMDQLAMAANGAGGHAPGGASGGHGGGRAVVIGGPTVVMTSHGGSGGHGGGGHEAGHDHQEGEDVQEAVDPRTAISRFASFWARDEVRDELHLIVDELTDLSPPPTEAIDKLKARPAALQAGLDARRSRAPFRMEL